MIGARVSPQLAQDGFHGHAGWLMFVLLGLPLVGIARTVPWFRIAPAAGPRRPGPPSLARDPKAALILPFMALMFASLLASTFALVPELWYPLKVLATLAVLAPVRARAQPLRVAAGRPLHRRGPRRRRRLGADRARRLDRRDGARRGAGRAAGGLARRLGRLPGGGLGAPRAAGRGSLLPRLRPRPPRRPRLAAGGGDTRLRRPLRAPARPLARRLPLRHRLRPRHAPAWPAGRRGRRPCRRQPRPRGARGGARRLGGASELSVRQRGGPAIPSGRRRRRPRPRRPARRSPRPPSARRRPPAKGFRGAPAVRRPHPRPRRRPVPR